MFPASSFGTSRMSARPATGEWMRLVRAARALTAFFWAGLVRIALVHHVTWSINSVCHIWGGRPNKTGDDSTNNPVVALVALGEGWHNNHHAFPFSARHGLRWWELDLTWILLRILEKLRLISNLKVPKANSAPAPS